jgi:hypothetical protein
MAREGATFIIISSKPNQDRSKREKELEDAAIRSHAASVSHERRKTAKQHDSSQQELTLARRCRCKQTSGCAVCRSPRKAHPLPQNIGGPDPFASSAVTDIQAVCHKALDYGLLSTLAFSFYLTFLTCTAREIFASIYGPIRPTELPLLRVSWNQVAVHHPFALHAEVVTCLGWSMQRVQEHDITLMNELKMAQNQQRGLALQMLRAELGQPDFKPTEIHVHAILSLACSSSPPLTIRNSEPYPLSPLADLQNLYAFSLFESTLAHVNALYNSVAMLGGIENMKLHAMGQILEL